MDCFSFVYVAISTFAVSKLENNIIKSKIVLITIKKLKK